ncbi:MAG: HD domain-containing protein [Sulfuricurvum sp.]|uniref:HD domain-containing phosphohydrolase n=1 Tax=Sulfuricurvum sp. TaxID=2025608 RepID=UPI00260236FA|nr:HD domain-containing phosphohydrolase [Sulfuricurvum sp.]MDD2829733.1 HD domain-containing protein [Sulfuricurvum sp.]MDD4949203.1 HD domain-containing protein [Sulfuricurvum sp.]
MNLKETVNLLTVYSVGMRVLYVEDESLIRENTKILLQSIFNDVETATNGLEGLRLYQNNRFDIVITDILMPEMNGVMMIKSIKEIYAEQRFIVTSACEDSGFLLELINLGVAQFLLKPIQTEQFIKIMFELVSTIYNERKVMELTEQLKQEVLHQTTLLEQYKEIVDISTIVTKTDLNGKILYANDSFCDASGYSCDEIMSKGHNLIRHEEMPREFYKNLWNTIMDKRTWKGIIKNRKKNGDYYITDTTIKPILDEYGEIIDFISTSHDITELSDINNEIWQTQHEMLSLLGEVGETRSQETGNHVRRVAKYSRLLGELYGLDEEKIRLMYFAAPMHDIGKIGIPDAILLKPGKLDYDEYEIMKTHSMLGYDILKNSNRPLLQAAAIIAHEHHEKWDGSGYPNALAGEEIHIYGRIIALADVFDALSCERIYKKAWPMEQIIEFITQERGKHFDPNLVDMFLDNLDLFTSIAAEFKD